MKTILEELKEGFEELKKSEAREFDSWILEKVLAGRIKPAFFVSIFLFFLVVISGNSSKSMVY